MFKHVLLAMDFSGPSMELFASLPDLQKLGLEKLLLVHVVRLELGYEDGISPVHQKFLTKVRKKKEELEGEGLEVTIEVPTGATAEEIRRLAIERAVDLILIGSIGESSRVRELVLGSTVADVIRIAPVPVLIEKYITAKKEARRIPIFTHKLAKVLLPTDFSSSAQHVYAKVLNLADKLEEAVLLHVIDYGDTREKIQKAEQEARERLLEWKMRFLDAGVQTEIVVRKGPPGQQIISASRDSTLIALARRGRGRLSGLLLGSTADHVIRRGNCPVLLFGKK